MFGCYLGEVLVRQLGGAWTATARSALRGVSPWPMVVVLPDGSSLGRDRQGVQAPRAGRQRVPARASSRRRPRTGARPLDDERARTTRRSRSRSPASSTCIRSRRARSRRSSRSTSGRAASAASCACGSLTAADAACSARWCGACSRRCRKSSRARDAPPEAGGWGATIAELARARRANGPGREMSARSRSGVTCVTVARMFKRFLMRVAAPAIDAVARAQRRARAASVRGVHDS